MQGRYKVLTTLFILISLLISSAYLYLPNYFQSLDDRVRDFYFIYRGPQKTSDDIVIIDIDEKSLKELGQWPWERNKVATILTNLTKSGAGIIGLDIIFAEADKTSPKKFADKWNLDIKNMPDYDLILSQTIANTPTILSYIFDFDIINNNDTPHIPAIFIEKNKNYGEFIPRAKGVLTNLEIIQESGYSSGFINNIPDETGIIRSVPLLINYDNALYPSLAFEMFRVAKEVNKVKVLYDTVGVSNIYIGKENITTDRYARLHINFRGEFKSYKYISAVDIYNNNIKKEDIEGKFVLIGTSAYGLMDLRATPMDSVIPGVEIQANVIDNLLNKDMLVKPYWGEFANIIIIITIVFIIIFFYSRLTLLPLIIIYLLSFVSILYLNYYILFSFYIILNSIFPMVAMVFSLISVLGIKYIFEFRQKEIIKNSFSKKVSKQVMEDLLSQQNITDLSSKEVNVTIYFSDIRSFTSISENLKSPKRITDFLNYYMNAMVESIEKYSGTIDKFIGDSIMAYWNAPLAMQNHADKAVLTALEQIAKREDINTIINKDFGLDIDFGIGINTGNAILGEIGSIGRSDYTIIGDAVNLASRLEGLCKRYKVRLIISEFTKELLINEYVEQLLDIVQVKGKKEPVKIYEIIDIGKPNNEKTKELNLYNQAHKLYLDAKFTDAKKIFDKLYEQYKKHLYNIYSLRCKHLIDEGVNNFDGIFREPLNI